MNPQLHTHESMLRESIKHFLTSYHNGSTDFSSVESIFFRLIQKMLDPPLEITWFYSAVTFHAAKSGSKTNNHSSAKVIRAKDLLNLLISCSNLSSTPKKIALLAPVVYELYNIVCDCREDLMCLQIEVEKIVDNVISYIVVCAGLYDCGNGVVEFDNSVVCFEDLVRVWMADRGGGSCDFGENLRLFFPILADGIWKGMDVRCGVRELVGIVLCQVFFLRLYLSFGSRMLEDNLLKDTAVQTIKGFRNFYFLDMLLKTLLEPNLPIAALLSPENDFILQRALYDAVMIEYSFYSGRWVQSDECQYKQLAIHWVLVVNRAIIFAGATGDNSRATSYLLSFYDSPLVSGLINWARLQAGIMEEIVGADFSTPADLIRWLMFLEHHGIKVFDDSSSMLHALAALSQTTWEETDSTTQLRLSPPYLIDQVMISDGGRKRKEQLSDLQESKVKQAKLDFVGTSVDDGLLNGSAVNKDTEEEEEEEDYYDDDDDDMDLTD